MRQHIVPTTIVPESIKYEIISSRGSSCHQLRCTCARGLYVALDIASGACVIMNKPADAKHYRSMGQYSSEAEAKEAIALGRRCHRAAKHP
jgi:hypothetical protein